MKSTSSIWLRTIYGNRILLAFCCISVFLYAAQTVIVEQNNKGVQYFEFVSQGQEIRMAYLYQKSSQPTERTVLLLHGKNFNASYWKQTADFLVGKGYNVLIPEQVGFGRSTKATSYQYSFQQLAYNTKQLLDSLNISNVIVLGHSMGGMLAVRFALMYPEKCTKLILENPIGLEDWKHKVPYSTIDQEYKKELVKTRESIKKYMTENYFHNQWKEEYETLLDGIAAYLKENDFKETAQCMALTTDMIFTQPVIDDFFLVGVPTVLIIGQADRTAIGKDKADPQTASKLGNYPALGRIAADKIKNSQLIELEGIGHIPHIENFRLFSEHLLKILKT